MRSVKEYTMHPNEDGACFICGNERKCYGYVPARTVESKGPYYKISLCASHGVLCFSEKLVLTDINVLIRRYGSMIRLSNRIPGHEINEFCRLTATDIERSYAVHPSVVSFKCFYCGMDALGQRDRSPTLDQLRIQSNFDKPRYVVPCCSACRGELRYHVPNLVTIEERRSFFARRPTRGNHADYSVDSWY